MALTVDIQRALEQGIYTPADDLIENWVAACLPEGDEAEVSIRIVENDEMTELNRQYRGQDKTTNVLSFPADLPEELNLPLLGDIVICAGVVAREAEEQGKSAEAHWAHMVIHGVLHLLGYDHIEDAEAEEMETLETSILLGLHYPAPYAAEDNQIHHE